MCILPSLLRIKGSGPFVLNGPETFNRKNSKNNAMTCAPFWICFEVWFFVNCVCIVFSGDVLLGVVLFCDACWIMCFLLLVSGPVLHYVFLHISESSHFQDLGRTLTAGRYRIRRQRTAAPKIPALPGPDLAGGAQAVF